MKFYIKQKVFTFKDSFDIKNEEMETVYIVKGKFFSIGAKLRLTDSEGQELYFIKRKIFAFRPVYKIYKEKELQATIIKKIRLFSRKFKIKSKIHSLKIEGNILALNFNILENKEIKANIKKKLLKIGDTYEMEVAENEDYAFYCALLVTIDNCLHNGK